MKNARLSVNFTKNISKSIQQAQKRIFIDQHSDGFWWYSLEANESINAEFIFLLHYLNIQKKYQHIEQALCRRILASQSQDGSWPLYWGGPGDLSTTVECYAALKMAGIRQEEEILKKARSFILKKGGASKARVFTQIHLAFFGEVRWDSLPELPPFLMLLPTFLPIHLYEFSSWARACIVPLILLLHQKRSIQIDGFSLDELFIKTGKEQSFPQKTSLFSWEFFFSSLDQILKYFPTFTNLGSKIALKKAEEWTIEHVQKTEDIFPALFYALLALTNLGHAFEDPIPQKCFNALLSFQQIFDQKMLPAIPSPLVSPLQKDPYAALKKSVKNHAKINKKDAIYQQCCVSPVWDTPWALTALLESGIHTNEPDLLKAGEWLISKQITETKGDWAIKNKTGKPGGWSFEFENEFFPDTDDTVQVLTVLHRLKDTKGQKASFDRGLAWLLSMQSTNGGWGAFDINNEAEFLNKIPFADHGACLDPPTADITGRVLELFGMLGRSAKDSVCQKALHFIWKRQENFGAWSGRWGVNYIYGTWCVLEGLRAMKIPCTDQRIQKAVEWLKSIQNADGGWSESCESYLQNRHIALFVSTASQTAWAIMALVAAGEQRSPSTLQGIQWLTKNQNKDGSWNEDAFTGTGFPKHFYLRYQGYRHYFPLLALARFRNAEQV